VWLFNAHHVKNVPGRKTDTSDAEWLADGAAHVMMRPSFGPPRPIRELRELTRYPTWDDGFERSTRLMIGCRSGQNTGSRRGARSST
jgi:hypothetical protein